MLCFLLIRGIPDHNFHWGVGMLTMLIVYPVYLLRRTLLERFRAGHGSVMYAHLVALAVALPVDIGVFVRGVSGFFPSS